MTHPLISIYLIMYIYIYLCIHIYIYIYINIYIYIYINICMYNHHSSNNPTTTGKLFANIHVYLHTYIYTHMSVPSIQISRCVTSLSNKSLHDPRS
jgi:hypothetical protein